MQIDLHGFEVVDAKIEIYQALNECKAVGDSVLQCVHGFRHGRAIRNAIRSNKFLAHLKRKGYQISDVIHRSEAITEFRLS